MQPTDVTPSSEPTGRRAPALQHKPFTLGPIVLGPGESATLRDMVNRYYLVRGFALQTPEGDDHVLIQEAWVAGESLLGDTAGTPLHTLSPLPHPRVLGTGQSVAVHVKNAHPEHTSMVSIRVDADEIDPYIVAHVYDDMFAMSTFDENSMTRPAVYTTRLTPDAEKEEGQRLISSRYHRVDGVRIETEEGDAVLVPQRLLVAGLPAEIQPDGRLQASLFWFPGAYLRIWAEDDARKGRLYVRVFGEDITEALQSRILQAVCPEALRSEG